MFSDEHCSPTVEVKKEGLRLLQTSPSLGTCLALPAIFQSLRYYEVEVVRNKGAVYIGWMEDAVTRSFPLTNPNTLACVGSTKGTFGVNSQTGSVGHNNTWKQYFGRKIRTGDIVGSLIDLQKGTVRFMLRSTAARNLPDVFPAECAFTIDPTKIYHAAVSLKYAQTQVDVRFEHPFALWDLITGFYKDSRLFATPTSLPISVISPIYNHNLPLMLASFDTVQAMQELEKASATFERNSTESLLLSLLPFETLLHIMSFVDVCDIPSAARTCRTFHETCSHYRLWNQLIERDFHFGLGISTQLYFDRLQSYSSSYEALVSSDALEILERNPYSEFLPTASELSKDRYRKRYNWKNAHFTVQPSIPTENSVNAMAYDVKERVLFFCVEENLFSCHMESGEVLESLVNTVGHIKWIVYASGYLVLGTHVGFIHVLDKNFGQVSRFNEPQIRTLDAYLDPTTASLYVLVGTKTKEVKLWQLGGAMVDVDEMERSDLVALQTPELIWSNTTFHTAPIVQVCFTPEAKGKSFVAASLNGQISIWYAGPGGIPLGEGPSAQWKMVTLAALTELKCMALSPEGWFGAVGSSSGEIQIFDCRFGNSPNSQLHLLPVTTLGSLDLKPSSQLNAPLQGARNPANVANGNRTGRAIIHMHYECGGKLVTTQDDNSVRYWNQRTGLGEWRHPTAGLTGSLLCSEEVLCFGLLNGRVAILDFDDVELTDIQLERSLNDRKNFLAKRSKPPAPLKA